MAPLPGHPRPLRWLPPGQHGLCSARHLLVGHAIVDEARGRRCDFRLDRDWAKGVIIGLERGLAPQEQASPLSVAVLRLLGAKASTTVDFDTVLGLGCALFTLALVDSFLTLGTDDIKDVSRDKVSVVLCKLKGNADGRCWTPCSNGCLRVLGTSASHVTGRLRLRCLGWLSVVQPRL